MGKRKGSNLAGLASWLYHYNVSRWRTMTTDTIISVADASKDSHQVQRELSDTLRSIRALPEVAR